MNVVSRCVCRTAGMVAIAMVTGGTSTTVSLASTFSIVPEESFLQGLAMPEMTGQFPGSMLMFPQGTLQAIVSSEGISFPGGSDIDMIEKAFPMQPFSALADWGAEAPFVVAAMRGLSLDFVSNAPLPLVGTAFDPIGSLHFNAGSADVASTIGGGSVNLPDLAPFMNDALPGSLIQQGDYYVLTLPVETKFMFQAGNASPIEIQTYGQIVAVAPVPEPSGIALALLAALGGGLGYRRARGVNSQPGNAPVD